MIYTDILDVLDDEARESLLESVLMAYCEPCYGSFDTFGRSVAKAISEAVQAADEQDADAAEAYSTDANDFDLERSVQCNAMNRRAA